MKIAISGKGGVGKTLLAAMLSKIFAECRCSVLVVGADPDSNLTAALGFPQAGTIAPIFEMSDLIEERNSARPGRGDGFFRLNPRVSDSSEKCRLEYNGVKSGW